MKLIIGFLFALNLNSLFASESLTCGTENQWPLNEKSGWIINLDVNENTAFVKKAENVSTYRSYHYSISQINNNTLLLQSDYNDQIVLTQLDELNFKAKYTNPELMNEEFTLTCYKDSSVKNIKESELKIRNLKSLKILNKWKKDNRAESHLIFESNVNIPFSILAQNFQRSISKIGDWEDTILNDIQNEKVISGKGLNTEDLNKFNQIKSIINDDIKNNAQVNLVGVLFGRDWYYGDGVIVFVVKLQNQFILIPFNFNSDAKFDDPRLDYIY